MLHCCLHACWCQQVIIPVSLKHNLVLHSCTTLVLTQGKKILLSYWTLSACEQSCLFYTDTSVAATMVLDIQILAVGNNNHQKTGAVFES